MNTSIGTPTEAPMFRSGWPVMTLLKTMAIAVPIAEPTTVRRAATNVQITIGRLHHLENRAAGVMKIEIKFMQIPVKKAPNMRRLAIRINFRILLISAGRAIVAPAKSSLSKTSTGLNQKRAFGFEQ